LKSGTNHFVPEPPRILPVDSAGQRPFWSVMIPTYNAPAHYLETALRSVLQQDPGPDHMQIEVVDDCSPLGAPLELVRRVAGDRVKVHCEPKNNGLAGIWNRCIERARGEWVHILHQDDLVIPGFYSALRQGLASHPEIGAAITRHAVINPAGNWTYISYLHSDSPVVLEGWHEKITACQMIQCPSIVVGRRVYERLGGFLPQFRFTLDWEMWQRIAAHYPFWFEPRILAAWRTHPGSTTSRLQLEADDSKEVGRMINLTMTYHPPQQARSLARRARKFWAGTIAIPNARDMLIQGQTRGAWKQVIEALRLARSGPVSWQVVLFLILWARLKGSRLKRRIRRVFKGVPLK
jgi:glycosyltransferase involved in cell wall biosynthesis